MVIGRTGSEEKQATNKNVIFTGFVSDREWEILISRASVLLYPSLYEGFGIPILDAFICDVPVVTSNISSLPEVAGEAAILVNPESVEEIAAGIIKAIETRKSLIPAGQTRAKRFSWKKTAQETLEFYQKIIS